MKIKYLGFQSEAARLFGSEQITWNGSGEEYDLSISSLFHRRASHDFWRSMRDKKARARFALSLLNMPIKA
jgi:hypothetical protein